MLTVKWLPQLRLTIRAVRTAHDAVAADAASSLRNAMRLTVQRAACQVNRKASER